MNIEAGVLKWLTRGDNSRVRLGGNNGVPAKQSNHTIKDQKQKYLDEKIREKIGLSENHTITKKHYLWLIKRIKSYCQNKMHVPTNKCCKEEFVNRLLNHLGIFIHVIPDI